jgi:hypothetical protein
MILYQNNKNTLELKLKLINLQSCIEMVKQLIDLTPYKYIYIYKTE